MRVVPWYNTMTLCTCPVLVHYGIVVNPCRDQSELVSEPWLEGDAGKELSQVMYDAFQDDVEHRVHAVRAVQVDIRLTPR